MSADASWAAATNARPGCPTEWADLVAELDAENARLSGELIDVQCELATARSQLKRLESIVTWALRRALEVRL